LINYISLLFIVLKCEYYFLQDSQWTLPKHIEKYSNEDIKATEKLQKVIRGYVGRMRARKLAHKKYTRFYDASVNKFYWMSNNNQKTYWKVSRWLKRQDIPLAPEDSMVFLANEKIKMLEKKGVIPITYEVPSQDILKNPKTKTRKTIN
jgi:hypothetical protein